MKILLVHRYYWPDSPPYASMLRTIAEHLANEGHEVDVFTAQPSYGGSEKHERASKFEDLNRVSIYRAPLLNESKDRSLLRAMNLVLFAAQVSLRILRKREYEVVMAATTPPILIGLAGRFASRASGARFVYHMQDIYPEVMAANSGRPVSLPLRLFKRLDTLTTSTSDAVVVLSEDMQESLRARGQKVDQVRVINNFVPDKSHSNSDSGLKIERIRPDSSAFQIIFAGNLGNFQGLNQVIDAFHELDGRGVNAELVLLGDGVAEAELRLRAGALLDRTIFFVGRVSQAEAEIHIARADLALVALNPGVIRTAFPSKTMTYLSVGTPVLAAVGGSSELGAFLESEGVGSSCELDPLAIADAVESSISGLNTAPDEVKASARRYASAESRLPQWSSLIAELDRKRY